MDGASLYISPQSVPSFVRRNCDVHFNESATAKTAYLISEKFNVVSGYGIFLRLKHDSFWKLVGEAGDIMG